MPNDVTIHVKWDDPNGDKFAAATKAKARKAGDGAGNEFSGSFTGRVSKGTGKATEQIAAQLFSAQKKIGDVGQKLGDDVGDGIERGASDGAKRGGKAVDNEMSRVAGRTNKLFGAKLFTGLSVGLPAAAAIGAVGAAAVLALPGAAVVGLSALILRNNDQVSGSFNDLSNDVISDSERMAQVMVGPLVGAASDLHASWTRLRPVAEEAFKAGAPEVKVLTGAVTDLAEGALPGMVTGLKASHPALLGVRVLAGEAGLGLGEFFVNASKGSVGAGQGMTIFAGTVRMLEARFGTLFANLANGSAGPLTQLHVIVDQATGALLDLTAKGSAATAFLTGFGSAAGGTLGVLRGVLGLLTMLPEGVAQFGGSLTSTAMIASKFGLDIGKGFEGLGGKVKAAGNDLSGIERTAAKAGTAVGGFAAGALSPATLAVVGLSVVLMALGEQQQAAATDTAAHAARERDLAAALKESNGAVTENVKATAAKKLADYAVSDGTRNLIADTKKLAGEGGVKLLTDGYLGNTEASKKLVTQLRATATEHTNAISPVQALGVQFDHFHETADGNTGALDDTGFAAKQLADIVEASGGDFAKAQQQLESLGLASTAGGKSMNALEAATAGLKDTASGTEERLSALVDVLNILEGRNATFEEAIQSGNDALRGMEESLKKGIEHADGFGKALLNADGSVNTFTANGSELQNLASGLQGSFAQAGGAIDEMVRKGMPFDQAVTKVNQGLQTQRDRFIEVAHKMGIQGKAAEDLANKYGLIPSAITTFITADTKQGEEAIRALPEFAGSLHGAVSVTADINPATNKISTVVQYADGSTGVITIDGNKDPVTGKTMAAVQYANGAKGFLTIDGFIQAAKDRTLEAKRNADGTISWIIVDANTSRANSEINNAARPRTAIITGVYIAPSISGLGAAANRKAKGGMVGYASGGAVHSLPRLASGGQRVMDVTPGGLMRGPGTGTSDSIMALSSRGPFAGSNGEFVVRASQTRKHMALLNAINLGIDGFASGGMVQTEDGGWVPESFYGGAPKGPHAMYTESGFAKLRASAMAGGIGSLSAMDQNQLRTYGGWTDAATGRIPAGGGGSSAQHGGAQRVELVVSSGGGGQFEQMFAEMIRRYVRVNGGGNVQATFGRG